MSSLKFVLARVTWSAGRDYLLITIGTLLQALAIRLFLVPGHLVNGGISGLAQLINYYTQFPIGVITVITRAEVNVLTSIVLETDPQAFIVIGQAHEVLGEGFKPLQQ